MAIQTNPLSTSGSGVMDALSAPVTRLAEDSLTFLVTSLAGRLNRGATSFYLNQFDIGLTEFRVVMALGTADSLNVGEVAHAAEIDKAAASRSLKLLQERGLVQMEQTSTRGRAAIVHITKAGGDFVRDVHRVARQRERRFVSTLSANEREQVSNLIRKLIGGIPAMNRN